MAGRDTPRWDVPGGGFGPRKGLNYTTLRYAVQAIEYLMDHDKHFIGTKREFAQEMEWSDPLKQTTNRRLVEDVCNLTRDQEFYPEAQALLCGYVISYSTRAGGLTLNDPSEAGSLRNQTHAVVGDLQMQERAKTIIRRRLPTWRALGEAAGSGGDQELARAFFSAENEISSNGFISSTLVGELFKVLSARGMFNQ